MRRAARGPKLIRDGFTLPRSPDPEPLEPETEIFGILEDSTTPARHGASDGPQESHERRSDIVSPVSVEKSPVGTSDNLESTLPTTQRQRASSARSDSPASSCSDPTPRPNGSQPRTGRHLMPPSDAPPPNEFPLIDLFDGGSAAASPPGIAIAQSSPPGLSPQGSRAQRAAYRHGLQRLSFANGSVIDADLKSIIGAMRGDDGNSSIASTQRRPVAMLDAASVDSECPLDGTSRVNHYVLLFRLGAGRQGEVFFAQDERNAEPRAIKVVRRPRRAEPSSPEKAPVGALGAARARQAAQLQGEIETLRRCRHRNIVALHEVIDDPSHDALYLVMQYVERGALARMHRDGTVSATVDAVRLARYARQLCAGLVYLHGRGIVHRDIKPDNILLGQDERVYLTDFGMAELLRGNRSSSGGDTKGTIAFNAPELLGEDASGARPEAADVWAFGLTLYSLLFGRLPWRMGRDTGIAALVDQITAPEPIDVPLPTVTATVVPPSALELSDSMLPMSPHTPGSPMGSHSGTSAFATDGAVALGTTSSDVARQWQQLLAQMLERDPAKRLDAGQVRRRVRVICTMIDRSGLAREMDEGAMLLTP